jgi:DNA polymerase (family X)
MQELSKGHKAQEHMARIPAVFELVPCALCPVLHSLIMGALMATITKDQIIDILDEIAILLEMKEANMFKIRAFQNAARVLEGTSIDLPTLIETGELEKLKGIGKGSISKIIHDLYEKGKSPDYEDLKKGLPATLFELLRIPGLGAKRIKILYEKLKIKSIDDLKKACEGKKLENLEGFGEKTQVKLLESLINCEKMTGQFRYDEAKDEADEIVEYLKKQKGIQKIEIAGSLRRCKEIVKDIDILVSAKDSKTIHEAFIRYPRTRVVVAHGDTKSSITLRKGINCDLRTVTEKEFPYALYYFTGSKEHNVVVRTIAKKREIKVNEYGLFKGEKLIPCKDEAEIFKAVGLNYVPPEARENMGEVEIAAKQEFPKLVEEKDLRGVFHVHSTYSDGVAPLEKMIEKAERMGLEYVGISDHSQSAGYAGGLQVDRLKKQWKEIDQLRKRFKIRIFKGIESDILGDGSLDYPEPILKEFDFVIGSIHSKFKTPEKEMTERVCRAIDNKYTTFIGHPTGRLLLKRVGYTLTMDKVLDRAQQAGVVMELNADPHRLDLDWRVVYQGKKKGVRFSINPDAHSVDGMTYITYGVGIARKGWLEKSDVVNTMPLVEMEKFLRKRR